MKKSFLADESGVSASAGGLLTFSVVPMTAEMVPDVAKLHIQALAGYMNVRLGYTYVKALINWFRQAERAIAFVAIDVDARIIGYEIGAPLGYARSMNRDLLWVVAAMMVLRPWLFFSRKFLGTIIARLAVALGFVRADHAEPKLPGPTMALVGIAVSPSVRGKKVGQRLIEAFEAKALELQMKSVRLSVYPDNMAARQLYERCGWKIFCDTLSRNEAVYYSKVLVERSSRADSPSTQTPHYVDISVVPSSGGESEINQELPVSPPEAVSKVCKPAKGLPPEVSIVVPCCNEWDHIETCVRSILSQYPPPGGFEVIVADGMSDDGTRDILKRLAEEDTRLRIVDNPGRIVSTGLNAAIRAAQGRIIVRMDAHTYYSPDYVRQCLAVYNQTGADNVGGPANTKSAGYVEAAICAAYHSPFSVGGARFHDSKYEGYVDTVTYGCWPREIFDRIGLFDEEMVRNQDDEFNLRLIRAGGKIWQSPHIKSWYRPRGSLGALLRQYMQYGYWKVRIIQKHKIPASWRHIVPGTFILSLIVLPLAFPLSSPALLIWLGIIGLYAACNITASLLAAWRNGWTTFPLLPLVFGCFHFAYGYGFLRGVWDFLILRRGPARPYSKLTRAATNDLSQKTAGEG